MAKSAVDPSPSVQSAHSPAPVTHDSGSVRFGMPHALVISVCVIVAAVLAAVGMQVNTVLILVSGAAGAGATGVLLVTAGSRGAGRLRRVVRAYLSASN